MKELVGLHPTVLLRDVWTIEDVDALEVLDWRRFEIIDGALVVSPSTGGDHELAGDALRNAIRPALPTRLRVVGPMGVQIERSYLIPDLVVAPDERLRGARNLQPADVVLAIVSPGSVTMDRVTKPAKYAAAGIENYWRVELHPASLTAYVLPPGADVYAEVGTWGVGEAARLDRPFPVEIEIDRLV